MTRACRAARASLFDLLMRNPPPPDRVFHCKVCGVELRGRTATFHEDCSVTCHDCTGREPDRDGDGQDSAAADPAQED